MDERVREMQVEKMELEDKVDVLCKALASKFKRLAQAMGNEHLYRSPEEE